MKCKKNIKITTLQKLKKRLNKQFIEKKYIGDIEINEEEYGLLLVDLKNKYHRILQSDSHQITDIMFSVTLVQIGIREYDNAYWPYVATILDVRNIPGNQQRWIGNSFIKTLKRYNKLYLNDNNSYGIICNILMHSFVTNNEAFRFFDFLYKFYELDLERDISRNTKEIMDALCGAIISNDNRNRTYLIQQHISDALKLNPRGAKIRIRRYLKLIDKNFWNDFNYPHSNNRVVNLLYKWMEESQDYKRDYQIARSGNHRRGKNCFISPYLNYDPVNKEFYIVMPPVLLMDKDLNKNDLLQWRVEILESSKNKSVDLEEVTLGYKTFEINIKIESEDLFENINIELSNEHRSKIYKCYKISKDDIRFFNVNGININKNAIQKGEFFAFSKKNFYVNSEGIQEKYSYRDMDFYSFNFEDGDIIRFKNNKAITIGKKLDEGMTLRGCVPNIFGEAEYERIRVYKLAPSFIIKTQPSRINGAVVNINDTKYRLSDLNIEEIENIKVMGERYYIFTLKEEDMKRFNSIEIDIPNDNKRREWKFVYINNFKFEFENAPYIFKRRGSINFSCEVKMDKMDMNIEQIRNENIYNFQVNNEVDNLRCFITGGDSPIRLKIPIPKLSWRINNKDNWKTEISEDIWYTDFPSSLQIKYIGQEIQLVINENDNDELKIKYTKMKDSDIFNCDLIRFKSYLDRDSICKNINIIIEEESYPFLKVITRSYVANSVFYADYEKKLIVGNVDILGKNEYFIDIKYKNEMVAEKIPVIDGKFQCTEELKNGEYEITIYEVEADDFGFEDIMYPIKVQTIKLANPLNLNNASLKIQRIVSSDNKLKLDMLRYNCFVCNLVKINRKIYEGLMVFEKNANIHYTKKVKITFPNLNEVNRAYIVFFDGDEELEYIYDSKQRIIVENEDAHLSKSECYRRYEFSLYPEEYIYVVEFTKVDSQIIRLAYAYESNKANRMNKIKTSSIFDFAWKDEEKKNINLNKHIEELRLTVKTYNCLNRAGFKYVSDIIRYCKYKDLLSVKNLDIAGKNEVYLILKSLGIY